MEFCKAFNAQTQGMEKGMPIPVLFTIYADRSFTFKLRTPPMTYFPEEGRRSRQGLEDAGHRHRRLRHQGAGA